MTEPETVPVVPVAPEDNYHLIWCGALGELHVSSHATPDELAVALRHLRAPHHGDGAQEAVVVRGERVKLSRSPRCLMLRDGVLPLYDVAEAMEPDESFSIRD